MKRYILAFPLLLAACNTQQAGVQHQYPDMDSAEFNTFAHHCSVCHAPPQPGKHTAKQWQQVVERMNTHRLQRGLPAIKADERAVVLHYLQTHARPAT